MTEHPTPKPPKRKRPLHEQTRYDQDVEWCEVQSLVRRPYAEWLYSAHVVLKIEDAVKARTWLRRVEPMVRFAGEVHQVGDPGKEGPKAKKKLHFNIAFTVDGLRKLGLREEDLQTFDAAFYEGMAPEPVQPALPPDTPERRQTIRSKGTTRRAGILGDLAENHSSKWVWGGTKTAEDGTDSHTSHKRVLQKDVHILLMVFARTRGRIDRFLRTLNDPELGIVDPIATVQDASPSNHATFLSQREHFGFMDGVSQPLFPDSRRVERVGQRWREFHRVATGEFVLGYLNERNTLPESPMLDWNYATGIDLPARCDVHGRPDPSRLDFGKNGTYLVARQLEQNVEAFDTLVEQAAALIRTDVDQDLPRRKAAELLIGRGVDGAPLVPDKGEVDKRRLMDRDKAVTSFDHHEMVGDDQDYDPYQDEDADDPEIEYKRAFEYNDFGYHETDPAGLHCPIGSHVRRSNPRDSLEPTPDAALNLSKQHRILRRGRIYGTEIAPQGFTRHLPGAAKDAEVRAQPRGLFFICLNSDIAGQFEFIQDTWANNPNFGDLEGERDAILAASLDAKVSLPAKPFTRWMHRGGPPVVTVAGGAYFFMPGRKALKVLCLPDDRRDG